MTIESTESERILEIPWANVCCLAVGAIAFCWAYASVFVAALYIAKGLK